MKKIILIALLYLVSFAGAKAQDLARVAINGLIVSQKYTDAQVRAALGVPTRYSTWDDEMGGGCEYQYGPVETHDMIRYSAEWGLNTFVLETPRFAVCGGRLRVGDPLTKIYQLGFGSIEPKGNGTYDCFVAHEDDPLEITAGADGKIVMIAYSASI